MRQGLDMNPCNFKGDGKGAAIYVGANGAAIVHNSGPRKDDMR